MPIYEYRIVSEGDNYGKIVEILQKISDPPLTALPGSGELVEKIISASKINVQSFDFSNTKKLQDNKYVESLGFTKYVKTDTGGYEKVAGREGPETIGKV